MNEHIMEAHQAYLEEKQLKLKFEAERKELGERIRKGEVNKESCGRYLELERLIEYQEREINYWARRVAERITEYSNNKDNP